MKIFVDANVIVSVLNREYPMFPYSARILSLADQKPFELYTSPICLAIAFYFLEKKHDALYAKKKMEILLDKLKVTLTDQEIAQLSIKNPKIHDFEDGMEYYSALKSDCNYIVTEDTGDFYYSEIPVYNCEDFISVMFKQQNN